MVKCNGKRRSLTIVVEGAGQEHDLSTECRRAFSKLIKAFGVDRMPSIECGGGRSQAFDKFKTHKQMGHDVILLIDSEGPVASSSPWQFLHDSGVGWSWLDHAQEKAEDCHLMVALMESWFIACAGELAIGSKNTKIPALESQIANPESVPKATIENLMDKAYKSAGQIEYKKGKHSFDLLERCNPQTLHTTCPWAARFFDEVKRRCDA